MLTHIYVQDSEIDSFIAPVFLYIRLRRHLWFFLCLPFRSLGLGLGLGLG